MNIHRQMEEEDAYGGPWIIKEIPRNPGHFLTTADIANAVAVPGRTRVQTVELVRHLAKSGHLLPSRRETEGRRAYLYSAEQVIAAEVLIRQIESGIRDVAAQRAAWQAVTIWNKADYPGEQPPAPTPGAHMIIEYEAGARDWTLEVWTFRHRETGQIRFTSRIAANQRGEGTTLNIFTRQGFEARAVFAVDVIDFLDKRYAFLFPREMN